MQAQIHSALGVFTDLDKAERSVNELRRAGFAASEIGIIGHVGNAQIPIPLGMRAPEDNARESLAYGGILGAIIGTVVIVVIPGLGALSGNGPWFEVLGGAVLGAAIGGALLAFSSFIFTRPRSRLIAHELDNGNVIVTVKSADRANEAMSLLRSGGGAVSSAQESANR